MIDTLGLKIGIGIIVLTFLIFFTWNTTTTLLWGLPPTILLLWLSIIISFVISVIYAIFMGKKEK